jgi:hypothetical protein
VRAKERTIGQYEQYISKCEESLAYFPEDSKIARDNIDSARSHLRACTQATDIVNRDTLNEITALDRLGEMECEHAPALLDTIISQLQAGIYEDAITGGYVVFILMTKLPGKCLSHCNFWDMSLQERDEIRGAFKEALL